MLAERDDSGGGELWNKTAGCENWKVSDNNG